MAITQKTREWFEKEHGYSLMDAYEVQEFMRGRSCTPSLFGDIDAENKALAERLAKPSYVPMKR